MLYRKKSHKPLPKSATVEDGIARWTGRDGKAKSAPLTDDGEHVSVTSGIWRARWTDQDGRVHDQSTSCTMRTAADRWLSERQREVELVRAGVVSPEEVTRGRAMGDNLEDLTKGYRRHLEAKQATPAHITERARYLNTLFVAIGATVLRDVRAGRVEGYLSALTDKGVSARTRNAYRTSVVAFVQWLVKAGHLEVNPFLRLPVANERADVRRERRALTGDEVEALLGAAREHYVHLAERAHRGKGIAALKRETKERRRARGDALALFLEVALFTGLRVNELRTLLVGDLNLGADPATLTVRAKNEKARRGATLPLHPDLADRLRAHTAHMRPEDPVIPVVPTIRTFDCLLSEAGVEKEVNGRTVDLHALRHTFITNLARAGVPVAIAQKLARHSTPELTMRAYTHLGVIDLAQGVNALPGVGTQKTAKQAKRQS